MICGPSGDDSISGSATALMTGANDCAGGKRLRGAVVSSLCLPEPDGAAVRIASSSLGCLVLTGGDLTPVCTPPADFHLPHRQLGLGPPLLHPRSVFLCNVSISYMLSLPSPQRWEGRNIYREELSLTI